MKKYELLVKGPIRDIEWFGGNVEAYQYHLEYVTKRHEYIEFENNRYLETGIPPGSIEIELGSRYNGHVDGEFEILSIGGKLWFHSDNIDFNKIEDADKV